MNGRKTRTTTDHEGKERKGQEQNKTEQSRTRQNRTNQNRQNRTEQNTTGIATKTPSAVGDRKETTRKKDGRK